MICGKSIYKTRTLAADAIKGFHGALKKGTKRSKKQPKISYFCSDCNGWHVSTGTKKRTWKKDKTVSIGEKTKKHKNETLTIRNFNK